jgi:hypothetical protein
MARSCLTRKSQYLSVDLLISILIVSIALLILIKVVNNNVSDYRLSARAYESFHVIDDDNYRLSEAAFLSHDEGLLYLTDSSGNMVTVNGTAVNGGDLFDFTDIDLMNIVCFYGIDNCPNPEFGIFNKYSIDFFDSYNSTAEMIIFSDINITDSEAFKNKIQLFNSSFVFLGRVFKNNEEEAFNVTVHTRSVTLNATFDTESELTSLELGSVMEQEAIYYDCTGSVLSHYDDGKAASCIIDSGESRALFFPSRPDDLILREILNNHVQFVLPENISKNAFHISDYFIHKSEIVRGHIIRW